MSVLNYTKKKDHWHIECSEGLMKIIPYKESIIRVRHTKDKEFGIKESLMIEPNTQKLVSFTVEEKDNHIIFATSVLQVWINKDTVAFKYLDSSGNILTQEPERGGKTLLLTIAKVSFLA